MSNSGQTATDIAFGIACVGLGVSIFFVECKSILDNYRNERVSAKRPKPRSLAEIEAEMAIRDSHKL